MMIHIKEDLEIKKLTEFYNFLVYMAVRTSMELRYEEKRNCGVFFIYTLILIFYNN